VKRVFAIIATVCLAFVLPATAGTQQIFPPKNASPVLFAPYAVPVTAESRVQKLLPQKDMAATCAARYCRVDSDCGSGCDCAHGSLCGTGHHPEHEEPAL